jgi:hypothetical protein
MDVGIRLDFIKTCADAGVCGYKSKIAGDCRIKPPRRSLPAKLFNCRKKVKKEGKE